MLGTQAYYGLIGMRACGHADTRDAGIRARGHVGMRACGHTGTRMAAACTLGPV